MIETIELNDGRIIVQYDSETGELISVEDWHGNEVSYRWERVAIEAVADAMFDSAVRVSDLLPTRG